MTRPEFKNMSDPRHLRRQYSLFTLDEKSVPADPFSMFFQWFSEAEQSGAKDPDAMVLATADAEGVVSARVVLLRGVQEGQFRFFTGYESRKAVDLSANPNAALTFFWPAMERQVRIEGKVRKLSRKISRDYFRTRPLESRISACVSPQSAVIPDRMFLEALHEGFRLDLGEREPDCPDNWGGYGLKPTSLEFWQGRVNRLHDRIRYRRKAGGWIIERLAP